MRFSLRCGLASCSWIIRVLGTLYPNGSPNGPLKRSNVHVLVVPAWSLSAVLPGWACPGVPRTCTGVYYQGCTTGYLAAAPSKASPQPGVPALKGRGAQQRRHRAQLAPCPLTPGLRAGHGFQGSGPSRANRNPECHQKVSLRPVIVPNAILPSEKHALQIPGFRSEASLLSIGTFRLV